MYYYHGRMRKAMKARRGLNKPGTGHLRKETCPRRNVYKRRPVYDCGLILHNIMTSWLTTKDKFEGKDGLVFSLDEVYRGCFAGLSSLVKHL